MAVKWNHAFKILDNQMLQFCLILVLPITLYLQNDESAILCCDKGLVNIFRQHLRPSLWSDRKVFTLLFESLSGSENGDIILSSWVTAICDFAHHLKISHFLQRFTQLCSCAVTLHNCMECNGFICMIWVVIAASLHTCEAFTNGIKASAQPV